MLTEEEIEFFIKLSEYLRNNLSSIYSNDYIPRLVKRICKTQNMNLELWFGNLTVCNENSEYIIEHHVNMYKGVIIDLGIFKFNQSFYEIPFKFPSYMILGTTELEANLSNLTYTATKIVRDDKYQTRTVSLNDEMILAVYNDVYASNIARELLTFTVEEYEVESRLEYVALNEKIIIKERSNSNSSKKTIEILTNIVFLVVGILLSLESKYQIDVYKLMTNIEITFGSRQFIYNAMFIAWVLKSLEVLIFILDVRKK